MQLPERPFNQSPGVRRHLQKEHGKWTAEVRWVAFYISGSLVPLISNGIKSDLRLESVYMLPLWEVGGPDNVEIEGTYLPWHVIR